MRRDFTHFVRAALAAALLSLGQSLAAEPTEAQTPTITRDAKTNRVIFLTLPDETATTQNSIPSNLAAEMAVIAKALPLLNSAASSSSPSICAQVCPDTGGTSSSSSSWWSSSSSSWDSSSSSSWDWSSSSSSWNSSSSYGYGSSSSYGYYSSSSSSYYWGGSSSSSTASTASSSSSSGYYALSSSTAPTSKPTPKPVAKVVATPDPLLVADDFLSQYASAFGFTKKPLQQLIPRRVDLDKLRMAHARYGQRVENKYDVFGSELTVHIGADGAVKSANGQVASFVKPNLKIKLSRALAVKYAKRAWTKEIGKKDPAILVSTKLIVVAPGLLKNTTSTASYLTYQVELKGLSPANHMLYFVDVQSGAIRFSMSLVQGLNRKVYDCTANPASGGCYSNLVDDTGYHHGRREGDPSWGPNPTYNLNDVDVLYDNFGLVHQYLMDKFQRDGMNGQGGSGDGSLLPIDVTGGQTYIDALPKNAGMRPNAFFSQGEVYFSSGTVLPDVVGHEYFHGLPYFAHLGSGNQFGMVYYGESAALNEAQSDVWGELLQIYASGSTDWLYPVGWPGASAGFIRSLVDPTSSAYPSWAPTTPYPDKFSSPSFYCGGDDNAGAHWNSTVVSHANYLMAVGGLFNGCTIHPIGVDKLEQILYRAVTTYYSTNETFNGAFQGQIRACADLYGANSDTCYQVTKALQATELDQAGTCSGQPEIPPACQCETTTSGSVIYKGQSLVSGCVGKRFAVSYACAGSQMNSTSIDCGVRQCTSDAEAQACIALHAAQQRGE